MEDDLSLCNLQKQVRLITFIRNWARCRLICIIPGTLIEVLIETIVQMCIYMHLFLKDHLKTLSSISQDMRRHFTKAETT